MDDSLLSLPKINILYISMQFTRKFTIIIGLLILLVFAFSNLNAERVFAEIFARRNPILMDCSYEGWSFKFDNLQ
jgi:hypothetical protein